MLSSLIERTINSNFLFSIMICKIGVKGSKLPQIFYVLSLFQRCNTNAILTNGKSRASRQHVNSIKVKMKSDDELGKKGNHVLEVEVASQTEDANEAIEELKEIRISNENPFTFHDYAKLDAECVVSPPVESPSTGIEDANNGDQSKENDTAINDSVDNPSMTNSEVCDSLLKEISATFLKDVEGASTSNNDSSSSGKEDLPETDMNKDLKNDIFHYLVTASVVDGEVAFSYTKMDVSNVLDYQNNSQSEDAVNENPSLQRFDEDNPTEGSNSDVICATSTSLDLPPSGANQDGDFLEVETNSELVTKGSDMMKLVTLNGWQLFVHEESKKYGVDFGSISSTMKSLWSEMGEQERKAYNIRGQIGILLEPCDKCGRTFSTFHKRNEHVNGCGPTKCPTCDKVFDDERKMKQHAMRHTQKFFCFECDTSWESASKLRRHQEKHNKKRAWPCEYCGKRYSQRYNLNAHHKRKHPEKI